MIVFNHINSSHLVKYSQELTAMGVLTAVIINEGLCYEDEEREYNAGKFHSGAHIDYYFCWNEPFKLALGKNHLDSNTHIEDVGPPRQDFYFPPWSDLLVPRKNAISVPPQVLLCTNFGLARYRNAPAIQLEKLFAPWMDKVKSCSDPEAIVEAQHKGQQKALHFAAAIAHNQGYELILRPHPREDADVYFNWKESLSLDISRNIKIDEQTNISSLILQCDLHIGCENCNTTMEAWLAKKPTITLLLDKHPALYDHEVAGLSPCCDEPEDIIDMVQKELSEPAQNAFKDKRNAHLEKWCGVNQGRINQRIADIISIRLQAQPEPNWRLISWPNRRRGFKLKMLRALGKPYNYNPFAKLKYALQRRKFKLKAYVQEKAVSPRDVKKADALIASCFERK
tara:strand:+ start:653 stop:1843 length:1191 start_codon:yes stop_codon:yes gene_type:complete